MNKAVTMTLALMLLCGMGWASGWVPLLDVPTGDDQEGIWPGGWLAYAAADGFVYASRGCQTGVFYAYETSTWYQKAGFPKGPADKWPEEGSSGVYDGDVYIYATTGNGCPAFWRYGLGTGAWTELANVPANLKGGTDLVYVPGASVPCIYLVQGTLGEFFRYSVVTNTWVALPNPPFWGTDNSWPTGSFLVFDRDHTLYAHRSQVNELWAYDTIGMAWSQPSGGGMPGSMSAWGGCGDWYDGSIYALKGHDTKEFWRWDGTWHALADFGGGQVGSGADIVSDGSGSFYALKGGGTLEFWRYDDPPDKSGGVQSSGVGKAGATGVSLALLPSPFAGNVLHVEYGLNQAGPARVTLFDISGRSVAKRDFVAARAGELPLDVSRLAGGVYIVRLDDRRSAVTQKLVVQR